MRHGDVPVLVFEGEYTAALVVRSLLESKGIEVSFDDLPIGGSAWGRLQSKVYVKRTDEKEARRVIASVAET